MNKWQRKTGGQSLIEISVCLTAAIPVLLFLLDMGFAVLCSQVADEIARDAARVAASQRTTQAATTTANSVISRFKTSAVITKVSLSDDKVNYVPDDKVTVRIKMAVKLPVPFPFINNNPEFQAEAVQPVLVRSQQS